MWYFDSLNMEHGSRVLYSNLVSGKIWSRSGDNAVEGI